ncbi:hypothetical protein EXIGLDRAFT_780369, partial [Exidia glandulosa HHB12029]
FKEFEPESFNLSIPVALEGVPENLLDPREAWEDTGAFEREVRKLAGMFGKAFKLYEDEVSEDVRAAGPQSS